MEREREILREKERWEREKEGEERNRSRSRTPPMRGARNTGEGAGVDNFHSTQESVASGLSRVVCGNKRRGFGGSKVEPGAPEEGEKTGE